MLTLNTSNVFQQKISHSLGEKCYDLGTDSIFKWPLFSSYPKQIVPGLTKKEHMYKAPTNLQRNVVL